MYRGHVDLNKMFCSGVMEMRMRRCLEYRGTSLIRNRTPLEGPAVGPCLGPYGGPRGVAFSYERGTPACIVAMLASTKSFALGPWRCECASVSNTGVPHS